MFRIAHISDLHLEFDDVPRWRELAGKRLIGYNNWRFRRRHRHKRRILDRLMADVAAQQPDHIIISGDLVNLGLPGEFRAAAEWLRALGRPERVSVVPGNHDAYVRAPFDKSIGLWRDYMTGDSGAREWFSSGHNSFPYVRVRGQVAIIGLSSAVPTPPMMAYGTLGRSQIERLGVILRRLAKDDLYRIVVVHHPPVSVTAAWWNELTDDKALQAVLKSNGAEMVLHGHLHRRSIRYLEGPKGITTIVGVPSASLVYSENRPSAAYHIYNIHGSGRSSSVEILTRSLKAMGRGFSDAAFSESSALPEFLRGGQAAAARAVSL